MNRALMCNPRYYTVDYEINPWMHVREKPDTRLAAVQWKRLYETLIDLGIEVELIEPVKGLPDMVFTANGGLIHDGNFILSNFRFKERQGEAAHFETWAERDGFEVFRLPENSIFEGEGDMLALPSSRPGKTGRLVAGYRFRSDIGSHNLVSGILGLEVVSVELTSKHFYHLDTCFCPLTEDIAIYYPGAFDEYGLKVLSSTFKNLLPLEERDARHFCANAVVRGKDIIMNRCGEALRKQLNALGFILHELDLSEFIKSGGSAKCLVLKLD